MSGRRRGSYWRCQSADGADAVPGRPEPPPGPSVPPADVLRRQPYAETGQRVTFLRVGVPSGAAGVQGLAGERLCWLPRASGVGPGSHGSCPAAQRGPYSPRAREGWPAGSSLLSLSGV